MDFIWLDLCFPFIHYLFQRSFYHYLSPYTSCFFFCLFVWFKKKKSLMNFNVLFFNLFQIMAFFLKIFPSSFEVWVNQEKWCSQNTWRNLSSIFTNKFYFRFTLSVFELLQCQGILNVVSKHEEFEKILKYSLKLWCSRKKKYSNPIKKAAMDISIFLPWKLICWS